MLVLGECGHFQVHFQKNQISNLSLIQNKIFQAVKNVKNCILTLNFTFPGQLGSLITSRHAFRSSWNFQKLIHIRYTSGYENFRLWKISFQDQGVHKVVKMKKWNVFFFQYLMLNISSIKGLLYKPSEI